MDSYSYSNISAPGKTSGEVHDRLCCKYPGKAIVTLGYGPDFTVLRSRGVLMNIPRMVRNLQEEIPEASNNGGGHLVVESIKFVGRLRTKVLVKLANISSVESTIQYRKIYDLT